MSLEVLRKIETKVGEIPPSLEPAIKGTVAPAKRNYFEIAGIDRSPKFFYAEGRVDDYKRTLVQRTAMLYFSFGLGSRQSGDLFDAEFQSWRTLRQVLQAGNVLERARSLWDVEEATDALMSKLRRTFLDRDRIESRKVLVQMQRNIQLMLDLCETEFAEDGFFKGERERFAV